MKKPAYLVLLTLVLALMCASVAFAAPAAERGNETQEEATLSLQDETGSALSVQAQDSMKERAGSAAKASVAKTSLASAQVTAQGMIRNVVSGRQIKPSVTLKLAGKTLVEGKDYRLKYGSAYAVPSSAGIYAVYAEALDSSAYSGSVKVGDYKLYASSLKSGTEYLVSPITNSNFMLDAVGKKPKVGANVTVWTRNNGANQKWYFILGSDGYYTIKNAANQSLSLDAVGKIPRNGANVSAWSGNNGLNQKWIIEAQGSSFVIRNAANPSLVLDATGKSPRQGANVTAWGWNGGNNQKWTIKTLNDIYVSLDKLAAQNKSAIADGTYVIYASAVGGKPGVGC